MEVWWTGIYCDGGDMYWGVGLDTELLLGLNFRTGLG